MPPAEDSPGARPRQRAWPRWLLAALLVLGVAGFYSLGLHSYLSWDYLRAHLDALEARVNQHYLPALGLFFLAYVGVTALSLPAATVLSLAAGVLFGRWVGTGVVLLAATLGATLGATLAFLSSRYLFRDWVRRRFGARLAAVDAGVRRDGAYYLLTLRLVPAFPFFLVNLAMGLTAMRAWTFAWVSLVGMLPGTFLYVNTAATLRDIHSPGEILSPGVLVSLALLGVVPLALRWRVRRAGRTPRAGG
jgi:uncharacterized membrane protein YdjX (TVP38/TMEM64 family)